MRFLFLLYMFEKNINEKIKKVTLLTVNGEVVTELYETHEVDVANLPAGHYLINATDSKNKTRVCRFVKE